jgi:23S rRNA (cytidine1920-2'-O)/16S rRNA (cytidine1409-2'-O)-methyltransferase
VLYKDSAGLATLMVADVSFISLSKIFPPLSKLIAPGCSELLCLIKPQFEVGRQFVEKGGVVKQRNAHVSAIETVVASAAENLLRLRGLTYSPLKGPAGNIEYLAHFANFEQAVSVKATAVVDNAFEALSKHPI